MALDQLGIYKKGPFGSSLTKSMFVPKGKNTIKVYEQKNAIKKDSDIGDYYITKDYFDKKLSSFEVFPNDVIVSCAGTIGETFVMPDNIERGIINQALMKMTITEKIDINYFLVYFDFILKNNAKKYSSGSAIKNIPPFEILKSLLVSLPPLNEQKRIVAKLEEILPFIEEYDKKEQKLTALNQQFPEQLKKSILQSAIQGRLVEQDPNDEPAGELIKRIQAEKARLILAKKIKKPKVKSEIIVRDNLPYEIVNGVERCIAEEVSFEIPESWCWVRLENITAKITDGSHNPPSNKGFGIPLLSAANIFDNKINFDTASRWISNDEWITENKRTELDLNDILLTIVGTIGRTAIVKDERKFALQRSVAVLKPILFYSQYLSFTLQTPYLIERMIAESKGTAQKGIYLNTLKNLYIPLPPLNEQKRIVQKIEELFSYIQHL